MTQRRAAEAIEWLEPLDPHMKDVEPSGEDGTLVLPVFPLGGPFMPYTKQKLNIFEPRFFGCKTQIFDVCFSVKKQLGPFGKLSKC